MTEETWIILKVGFPRFRSGLSSACSTCCVQRPRGPAPVPLLVNELRSLAPTVAIGLLMATAQPYSVKITRNSLPGIKPLVYHIGTRQSSHSWHSRFRVCVGIPAFNHIIYRVLYSVTQSPLVLVLCLLRYELFMSVGLYSLFMWTHARVFIVPTSCTPWTQFALLYSEYVLLVL